MIFTAIMRPPGQPRVENGTTGTVTRTTGEHTATIKTEGAHQREVQVDTREFQELRLAYAQHVYKAQGRTHERAFVLTGGWQTDRERAYVALTRARERTEIHVSREDLGHQGIDQQAIERLAQNVAHGNAQQPSINTPLADQPDNERGTPHQAQTNDPPAAVQTAGQEASYWASVEADPPTGPDTGHHAQQPESEAAEIMHESEHTHEQDRDLGWTAE